MALDVTADTKAILSMIASGARNETNPRPDSQGNEINSVAILVRELFYRAREAKRKLVPQWKRNYRSLNNRDYRIGNSPWEEQPAVSQIWPGVASSVAWLTDQRPTFQSTPLTEPFSPYWDFYDQLSRDMNVCLQAAWKTYGLEAEVTKLLWDTYTYGVGYTKTQWEAPLADGLGDSAFRRVDPFTIYPDPYAKSPADLSYIIEAKTMTVEQADRAWPGAARVLGHGQFLEDTDEAPTVTDTDADPKRPRVALGAITGTAHGSPIPANVPMNQARQHSNNKEVDSPIVTVLEAYVRGYFYEPAKDEDGKEIEGVMRVQDDWRVIVVCGNHVLMDDRCANVSAYGTHPYDRNVLYDTGEWYGPCMVEFLAPIQRLINWVLGSIVRNIYLMGNPVLKEDPRSATHNRRFSNGPGQRLQGTSSEWMNPPQMHPQMSVDLIPYLKSEIESILGLSAMVQGFAPTGRNAQGVLDSVQDAAFVRIRAAMRELELTLNGVGTKMCANIGEFYTENRLISLIGPGGMKTALSLRARHFYALDPNNLKGPRIPLRFSITTDSGSALPTSKQARAAEAKHLFELGAIDIFELLKAIGWPNYQTVTQRVMENQAMAAQAEAQSKS